MMSWREIAVRPVGMVLVTGLLATVAMGEEDWAQYRGPDRSGTVSADGLLRSWEARQPTQVWHRKIGAGFSAVSVAGERLFTMDAVELEEAVLAIDLRTGETVWRTVVGDTNPEFFPSTGPRSTPTIAGDKLYTVSSQSRLLVMSAESGEILWEKDLTEYGPTPRFGYSMSPLVDGDNLIVLVGDREKQPGIISFHKETGEVLWQAIEGPAGYSSPIVVELGGVRQYVFSTFTGVLGLSTTGEQLWFHDTGPKAALPMPIFAEPDKVFVSAADDGFGGLMIRISNEGGTFSTEELWKERLMRNHFNTSVAIDGYVYGFDNATFRCLDAETGKKMWAMRGFGKGSMVAADDLMFVLGDNGTLALVHATPAGYSEAGRLKVTEGRSWTEPSLAAGRIYVRDADELVSIDVSSAEDQAVSSTATRAAGEQDQIKISLGADGLTLDQVIAKHLEARGGAERWGAVDSLEMKGIYAAFSEESPFHLIRKRGDQYRLNFALLDGPAVRARDSETAWWQHALLQPEPAPIGDNPYKAQLERESIFGPVLLDHASKGIKVELVEQGEINGITTINLKLTFPNGQEETWYLDARTYREVAVDSQIYDFTQFPDPTRQRAFFSDYREVDGLVIPYRVDLEFGARLEEMRLESVEINPEIDQDRLKAPPPPPPSDEAAEEGS